jgi:hypothetical protein
MDYSVRNARTRDRTHCHFSGLVARTSMPSARIDAILYDGHPDLMLPLASSLLGTLSSSIEACSLVPDRNNEGDEVVMLKVKQSCDTPSRKSIPVTQNCASPHLNHRQYFVYTTQLLSGRHGTLENSKNNIPPTNASNGSMARRLRPLSTHR